MMGGGEAERIISPIVDIAKPVPILEGLCNVFSKNNKYVNQLNITNQRKIIITIRQHQSGELSWESLIQL